LASLVGAEGVLSCLVVAGGGGFQELHTTRVLLTDERGRPLGVEKSGEENINSGLEGPETTGQEGQKSSSLKIHTVRIPMGCGANGNAVKHYNMTVKVDIIGKKREEFRIQVPVLPVKVIPDPPEKRYSRTQARSVKGTAASMHTSKHGRVGILHSSVEEIVETTGCCGKGENWKKTVFGPNHGSGRKQVGWGGGLVEKKTRGGLLGWTRN